MKLNKFHGGYLPSPSNVSGSFSLQYNHTPYLQEPEEFDNSDLIIQVRNQGQQGSCVGFAISEAIHAELYRQTRDETVKFPSPAWNYYLGRCSDGTSTIDAGTSPSSVFYALQKNGFISNDDCPYTDSKHTLDSQDIPHFARLANDQKNIQGFARINSTGQLRINEIKQALILRFLVVFGTQVDSVFEDLKDDVWPGCWEKPLGGHCMVATGYTRDYITFLNSWGNSWGNNGYGKMLWSVIEDWHDIWIVSAVPNYSGT